MPRPRTFVVSVNDEAIFQNNFMISPCLAVGGPHQLIVQRGFGSASAAYNDAIAQSANELMVFAHQDVVLPASWVVDLERSLDLLEGIDPTWGVAGCYGETLNDNGRGYVYAPGRGILGKVFQYPAPVQTLDELVLILRKSRGLRFDHELPNFHFYGADICMAAAERGMKSYAICALCIHNSQQNLVLPAEFYQSYRHFRGRWRKFLPVQTTCARVTGSSTRVVIRRIKEVYLKYMRRKRIGARREEDGRVVLAEVERLQSEAMERSVQDGRSACV